MMPQRGRGDIQEYYNLVRRWRRQCNDEGMSDEEFMELYSETLDSVSASIITPENSNFTRRKKYCTYLALSLAILLIAANYKVLYSSIACNLQDYIYPGLRLLRKFSIPIISLFPSLTGKQITKNNVDNPYDLKILLHFTISALYHETCLINNPFFAVADMDCWPCSTVNNVMEVHKPKPVSEQQSAPFVYKTDQEIVTPIKLKHFYMSKKHVFDKEAAKILTDNKFYSHPTEMILQQESGEKHTYVWEFNNMNVAKILRQLIPRPEIVPKFGQSTERYLIVDTSQEQLQIPDTECNFSFLLSLSGSRTIELNPAEECKHQCKSLKVELKPTYLLWYNWWYWRPIVQPTMGNATFIAHVGSYC
ncbi:Uncharacterized protein OBRU01_11604 [Operophtera brumata]|uniref:Uncharacterized protein n=1 Tax=Operophtera brumata TaxID=104452 RepID=A0A0L7LC29_OPEBR|nr:Uncharacterized protein OBRU01_11604 [Operophtera brumata]